MVETETTTSVSAANATSIVNARRVAIAIPAVALTTRGAGRSISCANIENSTACCAAWKGAAEVELHQCRCWWCDRSRVFSTREFTNVLLGLRPSTATAFPVVIPRRVAAIVMLRIPIVTTSVASKFANLCRCWRWSRCSCRRWRRGRGRWSRPWQWRLRGC